MAEPVLRIEKLDKWFGVTHANRNIDFTLNRGEIRGLIGENGSGKSTLTSQICGIQQPTSGRMYLNGEEYAPASPLEANQRKVSMVVQELGVLGTLPGSINMFMGHTQRFTKGGILNIRAINQAAAAELDKYGFHVPLDVLAQDLSIEQRKLLELTKALSIEPDILVLDEITQALSHDNRKILYQIMHDFTAKGHSIIMISHDLEETVELCDTITVLRDGEVITTLPKAEYDLDSLKRMMIGRETSEHYFRLDHTESHSDEVILSVKGLSTDHIHDITFDLHKGEILGVCGLSDGGIHDLGRALFMKEKIHGGSVAIHTPDGGRKAVKHPGDITRNGGAYLSKDRDSEGLMLRGTIALNIQIPSLGNIAGPLGFINQKRKRALAEEARRDFEIKCVSVDAPVNSMSGGNKQKVNLSRWLARGLDFIILDCPTRGVDVGVKAYIYNLLEDEAKKRNRAILLISDELNEVIGMSDRLIIMKDGAISNILSRTDGFAEEKIVEAMI